jgi:hypothetical protein
MLEIYEPTVINFMAPLSQQDQFFVKEALDCIPDEYKTEENDDSLFDISARSSPASSRGSRSVSSFSRSYVSSRHGDQTFTDDEESDMDNTNDADDVNESVQDDEVSSSIEVRASKACTNLLEEHDDNLTKEEEGFRIAEKDDSIQVGEESGISLHDSGISSGRTSAIPTEAESLSDVRSPTEADGNDSSSSFEEINMETVEKEIIPAAENIETRAQ